MGNQLCVHAPRDNDEEKDKDLSSSDSEDEEAKSPLAKIGNRMLMESALNSTDFESDPTTSFRRSISSICKRKRLPFLNEIYKYNFFVWSSNKRGFGHESIVIGPACNNGDDDDDDNNYGYITAELRIDFEEKTVFPYTQYFNQYEGKEFLESNKWRYQYSLTTTLNSLIDFILALIVNHGKYSNLHNGCQHFVEAFLKKIIECEKEFRIQRLLKNNKIYQKYKEKENTKSGCQRYFAVNKIEKELKKEGLICKYDTMESTLQIAGYMLFLPVMAMAISKTTVKHNRDKVVFQCIDTDIDKKK